MFYYNKQQTNTGSVLFNKTNVVQFWFFFFSLSRTISKQYSKTARNALPWAEKQHCTDSSGFVTPEMKNKNCRVEENDVLLCFLSKACV